MKTFLNRTIKKYYFPFTDNCLSSRGIPGMMRSLCFQRQAVDWIGREIGGAGRVAYGSDIPFIFTLPFILAAQQSHFH